VRAAPEHAPPSTNLPDEQITEPLTQGNTKRNHTVWLCADLATRRGQHTGERARKRRSSMHNGPTPPPAHQQDT